MSQTTNLLFTQKPESNIRLSHWVTSHTVSRQVSLLLSIAVDFLQSIQKKETLQEPRNAFIGLLGHFIQVLIIESHKMLPNRKAMSVLRREAEENNLKVELEHFRSANVSHMLMQTTVPF